MKQKALRSIFFTLLRAYPDFFKFTEDDKEKYAYDSGSMLFSQIKILNDEEVRTLEIDAVSVCFYHFYDDKLGKYLGPF